MPGRRELIEESIMRRVALLPSLSVLSLIVALCAVPVAAMAAPAARATPATAGGVTSSSLGNYSPTFVGPAATGCTGCSLLSGPFRTPSVAGLSSNDPAADPTMPNPYRAMPAPDHFSNHLMNASPDPGDPVIPTVSCQPLGPGCDTVSPWSGGAVGVKGTNAVDSATLSTNVLGFDIEPGNEGLCAGDGYAVEYNNIGEILIFNTALQRVSPVISLDTVMGLTSRGWSSGGDGNCVYDGSNGGHWFFAEIASSSSEASGGAFAGCYAGVAYACHEAIAVTVGSSPFGPYNVYFLNADYNPAEPGYPYLDNDFTHVATTRDAFLLDYDEFPQVTPGIGGGGFNGAQAFAFDKNAMELGLPVTVGGVPNPAFNVARMNLGLVPTPDGTCASDNTFHEPGITCWYAAQPAPAPDPSQFDNSHMGSGFMLATLDFYSNGDDRLAVFDWTGLANLNSFSCVTCSGVRFGGQLFSGVEPYYGEGQLGVQKAGPIPLGDECGAAGLEGSPPAYTSCPEGGIATDGDFVTQLSYAQGQIWGSVDTEIDQTYSSGPTETHQGAAYWVIGTGSFDKTGVFTLTSQGYVSAEHEDLEMPAMAAEGTAAEDGGNGGAIMDFTLSGTDYYPSAAFGRVSSTSGGLLRSVINIADLGQSPQDGFTEYQGLGTASYRPRWGDFNNAIYMPGSGRIYFAAEYIQYPNCLPPEFTLTLATCGGTRDGYANWGTSMNYVVP
jgi:hypothetical protein